MSLKVEVPTDIMVISKSDLRIVLDEMMNSIQSEKGCDDILTIAEVATYMKVSVPTVRKLIDQNEIPCFKRGQVIRFNRYHILEWLKAG